MNNERTDIKELLRELELVFALPDHRTLHPSREPAITNFRPDYFSPDENALLIAKSEMVKTGLGTYRKKYDFPITSQKIGEVISYATPSMISSLGARVVIYERI